MPLDALIESILFFKGEPMKVSKLASIFEVDEDAVQNALQELDAKLTDSRRGIVLVRKDDEVTLGTAPEAGELVEKITKEELSKDLGKAALETLTIVLYKGPISKPEVDYIRGVNSGFILRNLLVRGLVERIPSPKSERSFLYRPSFDLLSHLGISRIEDLPEYDTFYEKIEAALEESEEK